jgi:hypothetical protein
MADVLRIKRRVSGSPGAPASLANAELAYNEVDHTLYYGEGTGGAGGTATVVVPIGGTGQASNSNPAMNGAAAPGAATTWSRGDHVHPVDTSRAPLASPVFTGDPQAPTPANLDSDNSVATTAYVKGQRLDQFQPPTADVTWNNHKLTGLADPTQAQDGATKNYVDSVAQGLDSKASVRAATTGNLAALSGAQTVDGVSLAAGDRVLVKDQATPPNNGIYVVQAGAWTRATDADTWAELVSAFTFVESGTVNADSGFTCTVDPGGVLGTTAVTWSQFSGAGQITAGNGLVKTGSVIDAVGTAGRISVGADNIDIDAGYAGQASIVTLGTIATGTWNATTIAVNRGGTGAVTLTGYLKGNGVSPVTGSATIPTSDITGLGSMATQNANAVAITGGTIDGITLDGGTF